MASLQVLGIDSAAIDLPCHGSSRWVADAPGRTLENETFSDELDLEHMAAFVRGTLRVLDWEDQGCVVVGYSMGARIALEVAARGDCGSVEQIVAISGSPGVPAKEGGAARLERDAKMAAAMRGMELKEFVRLWYAAPMWASLRRHPKFSSLVANRSACGDRMGLARVLEGCSAGRREHWDVLHGGGLRCRVVLIVGEEDAKFVGVAQRIVGVDEGHGAGDIGYGVREWETSCSTRVMEVQAAGHAVHLEQPLSLAWALSQFLLPTES
jgi:pimeloyl-ACP methyl ester carboxylesterase